MDKVDLPSVGRYLYCKRCRIQNINKTENVSYKKVFKRKNISGEKLSLSTLFRNARILFKKGNLKKM